jgi:hypothetical protein
MVGEREKRVKWLPAIPINAKWAEVEPVVHPVGREWKSV